MERVQMTKAESPHDHGKEPHPYAPSWRCVLAGSPPIFGSGLLVPEIFKRKDAIERFTVFMDPGVLCPVSWTVSVDLLSGRILFDTRVMFEVPEGSTVRRLIWFRRMGKMMHQFDANTSAFECLFYGVGLQATFGGRNIKRWLKILKDGRIMDGETD